MKRLQSIDIGWGLVILLSLFAVAPLTAPGFFLKAHDATIGAYFLVQFDKGIADGALYPRWAMDWTFGYGYPLFVVIAPLAFYVAEAFHLLGAGIADALKITYALAFVLSGLSMYLLGRALFGRAGGIVAAVLYVYAPYHLVDIYVRADLAEFASFAFFPAILWAIRRLSRAQSRAEVLHCVAVGALLYGGLILTHITMALIFTPVAVFYTVMQVGSRKQTVESEAGSGAPWRLLLFSAVCLLLGIAVSAAYLFPGFLEQRYLKAQDLIGGYYGYANHYVYPFQFLSPFWGYGYAAIGPDDQMPYQLGALAVVLALGSLWALRHMSADVRRHAVFFLSVTALAIFAMLSISRPVWDIFRPLVAFIQFPWRLLTLTSLSLALVGGAVGSAVNPHPVQTVARQAAPLLVLLALLASYSYVVPQYTDGDVSLTKMIQFQLDTKELLGDTIWVTEKPGGSPMVAEYLAGRLPTRAVADDQHAQIEVLHDGGASYEVEVTVRQPTDVLFRIRYFPGWRAYLDGKAVETTIRPPQGLMAVSVPAGEHRVLLRFEDTPLRRGSKIISLLGVVIVAGLLVWARMERRRSNS